MTTLQHPPVSAPVATPVPASAPAAAAPPKRAQLPARKIAKQITPIKKAAAKKVGVKKTPIQKAAVKTPLSRISAPAEPEETAAPDKVKKDKLVRDSFTIPKTEYLVLDELKQRAVLLRCPVKKSELLRAGIKMLANLPDSAFRTALALVPAIKTGRPSLTNK